MLCYYQTLHQVLMTQARTECCHHFNLHRLSIVKVNKMLAQVQAKTLTYQQQLSKIQRWRQH